MEVGAVCTSLGKTHTCSCSCIDGRGEKAEKPFESSPAAVFFARIATTVAASPDSPYLRLILGVFPGRLFRLLLGFHP